jgi:transposase
MSLPFEVETKTSSDEEQATEEISFKRRKPKKRNHKGRLPLPDHLPVEEIFIEPEEDVTGLKCIGKEITEELEYEAAVFKIIRYVRFKYAMADNEGVITGSLPTRPIDKCIGGPGLLARIHVSKFVYHSPFHRQVQQFKTEHQVTIPRSTIDGWQTRVSNVVWPLYEELKRHVLGQGYIQLDETPIKVLDQRKKGTTHRGFYWVYHSPIEHMFFFDYQQGRGREGPRKLLTDFKGYLQTDGYKVYDWFGVQKDIILVNCMAHARRYQYV